MSARNHISFDLAQRLDNAPAPKVTLGLLRRIVSFLKPYTRLLVASFSVIVASAGLGVVPSLLTGAIIDKGLLAGDFALLCQLVLLSLILLIVSNGLGLLESGGLITRQVSQHDRRIYNRYLTDEGVAAAKEVDAQAATTRQKITADLSEEDLTALIALLEKLNASIRNNVEPERLAPPPHPYGHHRPPFHPAFPEE